MLLRRGVDILTHAPLDADVDDDLARSLAAQGIVSVPTLTMMRAVASLANVCRRMGLALTMPMLKQQRQRSTGQALPFWLGPTRTLHLLRPRQFHMGNHCMMN